jgi:3-oxoacyl-[acyl-carrier protein] reductase
MRTADTKIPHSNSPHAVVSGVSSGIGQAIADTLLAAGWRVTGLCRSRPERTHERLHIVQTDLADPSGLPALCADMAPVDALIHAAGFMRTAPLGQLSPEDSRAMWTVHVLAAECLANALVPKMANGARIVLIGSRVAQGAATRSQYASTKSALVGMTRSWAAELAPRGITANVIAPGATDTPFLKDPARAQTQPRLPPIGRFVRPEEVAALTAFLVGPFGGAITGQHIVMCGGSSL